MPREEQERRWQEGPRVRVRPRPGLPAEPVRVVVGEARSALRALEQRFLALQASLETRPPADLLADCLTLLSQLKELDQRLEEVSARRDLPYGTHLRLTFLNGNCRWLTRRISTEVVLALQVHLEQRFRRLVDPQAYQLFLRLDELSDAGREIEALSDRELMSRLRDGTLVRDVLESVRLMDVVPWPPQPGSPI
jgi:hypothetical protein